MRRRSDAGTGKQMPTNDSAIDVSDLELDDDAIEDGSDQTPSAPSSGLTSRATTTSDLGIAPAMPMTLQFGTFMTKIAKGKRKKLFFRLDFDAGKISWSQAQPSKQIYIDDVVEVRHGWDASQYREELGLAPQEEKRWFTLIYTDPNKSKGHNLKTMHLVADSEHTKRQWVESIENISRQRIRFMTELAKGTETGVRKLWSREIRSKFGPDTDEMKARLDFAAVRAICRRLDINCSEKALRDQFNKVDKSLLADLNLVQFQAFVKGIKERKDIKELFEQIKPADQKELDFESFLHFLKQSQKLDTVANLDMYRRLFEHYAKKFRPKDPSTPPPVDQLGMTMNLEAFQDCMVISRSFQVINTKMTGHPLTHPLKDYFISSSHNTYLLGRQVAGQSSTEAYKAALMRGCRCIEIDCWDGADGRPIVTHGRTMTQSVPFLDCIKVINEFAFATHKYPLIISLEVHCNPEQQVIMTENMINVFGDKLVQEPLNSENVVQLPSPEELKERILIKVKAYTGSSEETITSPTVEPLPITKRARGFSSPFVRPTLPDSRSFPGDGLISPTMLSPTERPGSLFASSRAPSIASVAGTINSSSTSGEESDSNIDPKKPRKKTNIVEPLGKLGIYTQGAKYHNSFNDFDLRTYNHVLSFSERAFDACAKSTESNKDELEMHNKKFLMRVYPAMHRIRSDNFDPLKFWRRGVQMAALNWQTYDLGMQLNEAMFAAGDDQSGYVLKPADMRSSTQVIDQIGRKKTKHLVRFNVHIMSAQQLPRPSSMSPDASINPYVEFEVHTAEDKARGIAMGEGGNDASARNGMSGIGFPIRRRTAIVQDNGYDPLFKDSKFSVTVETKYPSLVFVRWTVWNSADGRNLANGNVPLASHTAKLDSVQEGYRHVPLYNARNEKYYFSTLFCNIQKEVPVAIKSDIPSSQGMGTGDTSPMSSQPDLTKSSGFKRLFSRSSSQRNAARKQSITVNTNLQTGYFASGSATGDSSTLSRTSSLDGRL